MHLFHLGMNLRLQMYLQEVKQVERFHWHLVNLHLSIVLIGDQTMAAAMIITYPIIIVFVLVQKQFVEGLAKWSCKRLIILLKL